MLKHLYIKTYGCQMNVYDSDKMADVLKSLGYDLTSVLEEADFVILNTCHIREKASEKAYSELGRLRELKEEKMLKGQRLVIAVAGCTAQAEGAEIKKRAPYVDMVFGPQAYHLLPEMVARLEREADHPHKKAGKGIIEIDFPEVSKFDFLPQSRSTSCVSAFLAVQEGCDKFCHFCVVPYTRGAEYSRPVQDVLKEAQNLIEQGTVEMTLLGQNVNAYHGAHPAGKGEVSLGNLIRLLADIKGLQRIRYMTSHPCDVDEDLVAAHRDVSSLMPFLHLPVQSGSNKILKSMNRRHTAEFYHEIIEKFRNARSDMAFSSDFIVGYPGETDKDFEDTLELIRKVGYAQAYSFKYSPRPGTPASILEDQVPENVKDERLIILQDLLRTQQLTFNQRAKGLTFPILFEKKGKHAGQFMGKSPYLQSVYVQGQDRMLGKVLDVKITEGYLNSLTGDIIIQENSL